MAKGKFETMLEWASVELVRTGGLNSLADLVITLLGEAQPCGFSTPTLNNGGLDLPSAWADTTVSPDEARAMARMLLVAADEAEKPGC